MATKSAAMMGRLAILGVVVVLVIGGWTAFWWIAADAAASASGDAIARAAEQGIAVECENRRTSGWPLRLVVGCERLTVRSDQTRASLGAARAMAQVMDPTALTVEAEAPLALDDDRLPGAIAADWQNGSARLRLGSPALEQVSLVFADLAVRSAALAPFADPTVERLDIDARRADSGRDLDVVLLARTVKASLGATGLPTFDLDLDARIGEGAVLLAGQVGRFREQVRTGNSFVELDRALVSVGRSRLQLSGRFSVNAEGYLEGQPQIAVADPDDLLDALAQLPGLGDGRLRPILTLAIGMGTAATVDGRPGRAVTVSIRDGHLSAGLIPFGRLPRLRRLIE